MTGRIAFALLLRESEKEGSGGAPLHHSIPFLMPYKCTFTKNDQS